MRPFLFEVAMTMFKRQGRSIKEGLEKVNADIDAQADKSVEELKQSKWTGMMLIGAVVMAVLLVCLTILFA